MQLDRVPEDHVDWRLLDAFEDRTFSQRSTWLEFVRDTQTGDPVVAQVSDGGRTIGYFTGVVVRRFGVKVMGSPFPGWSTPYMGLNLVPGVRREEVVRALVPFVFESLGCSHFEIADPFLSEREMLLLHFSCRTGNTFRSDLTETSAEMFSRMDSACRRCIRKAEKSGVWVEEAAPDGFAAEYYEHLCDVFAKQDLTPTYGRERVEALIRHVHHTGDLLLLRARDPTGRSIATGIYPGFNAISYFWGNGSLRQFQNLRPNEALHWNAMKYWKNRGVHWHYWGGGGDYKRKYGGEEVKYLEFRISRNSAVGLARDVARTIYYFRRAMKRRVHLANVKGAANANPVS